MSGRLLPPSLNQESSFSFTAPMSRPITQSIRMAISLAQGLSAKKAVKVELFDPKGGSLDCFNLVNFVKKASASYSRVPDGTGAWYFTSATPAAKNANETADKVEGLE